MILVTGGSASGKSAFAEKLAEECQIKRKIYIATMQPYDRECEERIEKHRHMRKDSGFATVECYGLSLADAYTAKGMGGTGLFECMSNYVSNVMFGACGHGRDMDAAYLAEAMISELTKLDESLDELIVVTNEIFSDGAVYDDMTQKYLQLLGLCNRRLAGRAEKIYEVVCGLPRQIQGFR